MKYKCTRCGDRVSYLNKSIFDNSNICDFCFKREVSHKDFKYVNKQRKLAEITGKEFSVKVPKTLR